MTAADLIPVSGELEPTSVYRWRRWSWVRNPDKTRPGHHYDGLLCIRLRKSKGPEGKVEKDTYAVEEQPAPPGFIGRRFYLLNLTDGAQADVYECHVGFRPGEGSCTCPAGRHKAPSDKHREALFALMQSGVI